MFLDMCKYIYIYTYIYISIYISTGYGLLPGRLQGSCGYLDREVFVAVSGGSCRNERRENLYGANDSVYSGTSNFKWLNKGKARPAQVIKAHWGVQLWLWSFFTWKRYV